MTKLLTVREIISRSTEYLKGHGVDTARLDSELLLAEALNLTRIQLYLQLERPLQEEELARLRQLLGKRAKQRVPVAYLLGKKEFYGLDLAVSPQVLIPRPETELLVELVAKKAPKSARALEVGIGSGAISISLAKALPELKIWATDLSREALLIAQENCQRHQVAERIQLLEGDLFAPVLGKEGFFEVVVANPPYIPHSQLPTLAPELRHEPQLALDGGPDGLSVLEPLVREAYTYLAPGGLLALELGEGQGEAVTAIATKAGFVEPSCHNDYSGFERFFIAWRPNR